MSTPEAYARGAEGVLNRGFTALKFDPLPGPWRTYIPKQHIRSAVKVTRAVRDAVDEHPGRRHDQCERDGKPDDAGDGGRNVHKSAFGHPGIVGEGGQPT